MLCKKANVHTQAGCHSFRMIIFIFRRMLGCNIKSKPFGVTTTRRHTDEGIAHTIPQPLKMSKNTDSVFNYSRRTRQDISTRSIRSKKQAGRQINIVHIKDMDG